MMMKRGVGKYQSTGSGSNDNAKAQVPSYMRYARAPCQRPRAARCVLTL